MCARLPGKSNLWVERDDEKSRYNEKQRTGRVIAGPEQSGREESPDTVVVGSQEPVTKYPSAASPRLQGKGQRAW
jgi:hypothetical protein